MAKSKFNMSEIKKNTQSVVDRKSGGGGGSVPYLKLNSKLSKILILPPKKKDLVKRVVIHQVWKGGKPIKTATCPRIKEGGDCKICKRGFDLRDKYSDSSSKRKQDVWRIYMPTDDTFVGALDITEKKPTPKVLRMPPSAFQVLVDELEESVDGSDIFDLDKGRPFLIKGNGKEGKNRRYVSARFSKSSANLVSDGKVDEDDIINNIFDLDKLLPKISDEKVDEVFLALKKQEQSVLSGGSEDEEDADDSDDDDEPKSKKSKKSKDDDDDDDDADDSDDDKDDSDDSDDDDDDFKDDEDEEDEKPAKKNKKSKDDDFEDDEDDESDDEDDSDDDDDEDDEPVKKKSKDAKKSKLKKKK